MERPQSLRSLALSLKSLQVADEYPGIEPYNSFGLQPAEIAGNKFADGSDL